jgi:hypothetical protein
MARRGQVDIDDFRVIYRSERFPTSSFAYDSRLEPELRDRMLACFLDYRFTEDMQREFDGAGPLLPCDLSGALGRGAAGGGCVRLAVQSTTWEAQ